jgi:hypothetical protein
MSLSILYAGASDGTSRHRALALRDLGHLVDHVADDLPRSGARLLAHRAASRMRLRLDFDRCQEKILHAIRRRPYDVLWIDRGNSIRPATLRSARRLRPALAIVSCSVDDMTSPAHAFPRFFRGLALYDLHVTTKSANVERLVALGAKDVVFIDNAFDPRTHRPVAVADEERRHLGADVGFVGTWRSYRAATLIRLADRGVPVRVFGGQWHKMRGGHPNLHVRGPEMPGHEYAKAIACTRINLGLLVREDVQTTRSVEIPACGGFMLAERTDEHRRLFEEGVEAEYFGSDDELLEKCRYYLSHEEERRRIAAAGRARCLRDGYSNAGRLAGVLERLRRRGALPR